MTILKIYENGLRTRLKAAGCTETEVEESVQRCCDDVRRSLEEFHCLCDLAAAKDPVSPVLSAMVKRKAEELRTALWGDDGSKELEEERKRLRGEIDCLVQTARSISFSSPALDRIIARKKKDLDSLEVFDGKADLEGDSGTID